MRPDAIRALLETLPRTRLASVPTSMVELPRLRAALGPETPEIRAKLEEETAFGLGGNKVRKLEYELGPPRLKDVTHLVTVGGVQSNHARVTAAAAARLGLGCVLILNGDPPDPPTGNHLLHRLLGAKIRIIASRTERDAALEAEVARIAESGGKALAIPLGASTPLGALGYIRSALEINEQLPPESDRDLEVVLASSSGGTLAGLLAGFALLGREDVHLLAVSSDTPEDVLRETALELAAEALQLIDADPERLAAMEPRLDVTDAEVGPGYGIPTEASREATALLARSEGLLVDPTYTSKAMAGLVGAVRSGRFPTGDRILFVHTGGHPGLFA